MTAPLNSRQVRATTLLPMAMLWVTAVLYSHTANAQAPQGSLAERLKAVQNGQADGKGPPVLPAWKPVSSGATAPIIPLVPGLKVVTAINAPLGDYESIKSIQSVGADVVRLQYSADKPQPKMTGLLGSGEGGQADPKNEFPDRVSCLRLVDVVDLAKAHGYSELFCESKVEHFTGVTSISASTEMLNQLRAGQPTEFHFAPDNKFAVFMQLGAQVEHQQSGQPTLSKYAGQMMYSCSLHRVGAADVAVPVLLNDLRVELPALHAMCTLEDKEEVHVYYLDQPANPLTLAFQLGPVDSRLQVIKITIPPSPPPTPTTKAAAAGGGESGSPMEQALAARKPVIVYGIYFDFASATIKPESEAVLRQIADIMRKNPDWSLSVSGFTDNIGGDKANLALSQRRSAAVKDALVTRYQIAPGRLVTGGYGASAPIETNATLEGRARNRRVQLQRQ
jgi:outer membrane protein OmpA-like peptidoglycan-associated protein